MDIFVDFEVESSESKETGNDISGCGDGAVDRNKLGPFGIIVLADDELSELTPIYFRHSNSHGNAKTYFCADETRFVTLSHFITILFFFFFQTNFTSNLMFTSVYLETKCDVI